jgi:hypothetical protein
MGLISVVLDDDIRRLNTTALNLQNVYYTGVATKIIVCILCTLRRYILEKTIDNFDKIVP